MRAQHKEQYERHFVSLPVMGNEEDSQSVKNSASRERSKTTMPTEDTSKENNSDAYTINASEAVQYRNLRKAKTKQSQQSTSYGVHIENEALSDGASSETEDPLGLQEVVRRNNFCEGRNERMDNGPALLEKSTLSPSLPGNERCSSSNNTCVTTRIEQKRNNVADSCCDFRTTGSRSVSFDGFSSPKFPMDEAILRDQTISFSPDELDSRLSNNGSGNNEDEFEDRQLSFMASRRATPHNECESEDHEESNAEIDDDEGTEVEIGASVASGMAEKAGKEIEVGVNESSEDMNIDECYESEVEDDEISQIASDEGIPQAGQHGSQYKNGHQLLHKYGPQKRSTRAASKKETEGLRRLQEQCEIDMQSKLVGDMELEEEEMNELQSIPIEL